MLRRLFPQSIDNSYGGLKLAIWILVVIALVKAVMGLTSTFIGDVVAAGAHRISLGAFPPEAAQLVVLALARAGLSAFVLALLCVAALVRYHAMIPLVYHLLLVDHTGRAAIFVKESAVVGLSKGAVANFVLLILTVVGLLASLWGASKPTARYEGFSPSTRKPAA
jgi:hypothetical protein